MQRLARSSGPFQNLHHDIFDLDTNAAPVPVEITKGGKKMKVVVQTTKQGMIWILDAGTGKPVFPYEERPVAQSQVPGEKSSPTQPFTILPPPLMPATVSRDHLSQLSDARQRGMQGFVGCQQASRT